MAGMFFATITLEAETRGVMFFLPRMARMGTDVFLGSNCQVKCIKFIQKQDFPYLKP